jgi:hypothetical protein
MGGNPAKVVPKATCRCSGQFGFEFFGIGLRHPLHRLIFNRALCVKDRSQLRALPKVASIGYRRFGGRSLLSCLWFLCESLHG